MKSFRKTILACALLALPLAGCSQTALSTHGVDSPGNTWVGPEDRDEVHFNAPPRSDNVSRRGDNSKDLLVSGQEHFLEQNYGLAEQAFRQAVEVRADNASAWMGLAASYDQLGRFDFADRAYDQLRDIKGDDARVLNNMGYSYLLRGNYKKARIYFNRAQKKDPLLEEVQGNIHLLEKIAHS